MAGAAQVLISIAINSAGATAGAAQANRALDSVATRAQTVGSRLTSAGVRMDRAGRTLTRNLTIPVLGAAAASVKMAYDFDRSLTRIDALVGASDKQMKMYREGVLALSGETARSPEELGDALYFVTSSGFEGAKALDVLTQSAKASGSQLGETGTIADAVTSAMTAYKKENLGAAEATDIMLAAVREGKAEGQDFAGSIGRIIPLASEMGVGFEEVAAGLGAMSLKGTDAAEGSTALIGVLNSFLDPAEQTRDRLEKIGLSADEVRDSLANRGLLPTLLDLKKRLGENKDALGELFPNVRALKGFLALTGGEAGEFAGIFRDVANAVGDTDKAFEETKDSEAFKMADKLNKLKIAAVELGTTLIPVALEVADVVSGLAKSFTELDESTQKWLILAAIGGGPALRLGGAALKVGGWAARTVGGIGPAAVPAAAGPAVGRGALGGLAVGGGPSAAAGIGAAPLALAAAAAVALAVGAKNSIDEAKAREKATETVLKYGVESEKAADSIRKLGLSQKVAEDRIRSLQEAERNGLISKSEMVALIDKERDRIKENAGEIEELQKKHLKLLEGEMHSAEGAAYFSELQGRALDLNKRQTIALGTLVDKFGLLGVALDEDTRRRAGNLLAAGDFKAAMDLLNDAFDDGVKKTEGGRKKLGEFGGTADISRDKVKWLSDEIRHIPTPKEIRIRANTIEARRALEAFIAKVRATHLTMNLDLNAGGPMGPGAVPRMDSGGMFQLPKAPGTYALPSFSKGHGDEAIIWGGLGRRSGGTSTPVIFNIYADSTTDGRKLLGIIRQEATRIFDGSEDVYQRERQARGRR